jgi:glycosyltransferase involved in cell wall biosynthesis
MKVLHLISGGETGGSRKHVVSLLKMFPKEEVTLGVFQAGPLLEEAKNSGINVELFSQRSRYDLSVLTRLISYINQNKFDIVHSHGPRANLFSAYIRKRIIAKWVTTLHSDPSLDFMTSGYIGKIFSYLNKNSVKKADLIFAVSDLFSQMVISYGIPESRVKTIFNGISFDDCVKSKDLDLRKTVGLERDDFVISMVARLHPVKGHQLVLDAIQQITNNDKIKLLLIGDGSTRTELEEAVKDMNLNESVKFLGFRDDVEQLLSVSDISILASFSESFPLALLESANVGTPIISTDVGGVNQLINSKDVGWLIPIGDKTALKNAIEEAMNQKQNDNLTNIGEHLHDHAKSNFSLNNLYQQTIKQYNQIVKSDLKVEKGI